MNNEEKAALFALVAEYNTTSDEHFRSYLRKDIKKQIKHLPLEIFETSELTLLQSALDSGRIATELERRKSSNAPALRVFEYRQNNSGGSFHGKYYQIFVTAPNAREADALVELYFDVYFDGCSTGIDCSCCGDRWYNAYGEGDEFIDAASLVAAFVEETRRYKMKPDFWGLKAVILTPERTKVEFTEWGFMSNVE